MNYFDVINNIQYEGPTSTNPYAFKFYNPNEVIGNKTMEETLRYSVAYWHTFTENLSDPCVEGVDDGYWNKLSGMHLEKARVEAAFELFVKLGVHYFCIHDVDIAAEGESLKESNENLDIIVIMNKDYMQDSKVKLLWN